MSLNEEIDYTVVVNEEEQYSLWPTFKAIPSGWNEIGFRGNKQQCLDHIKVIWTDMRPLSLRKQMEEWEKDNKQANAQVFTSSCINEIQPLPLVAFLINHSHSISLLPVIKTPQMFQESLNSNYVHFTFTDTQGSTSIGMNIDSAKTKLINVDFKEGMGQVHIQGNVIIDYVHLRCNVEIDLSSLTGKANVSVIEHISPLVLAEQGKG